MIATCPKCSTRFLIPSEMISPQGRRVKCSKCHETWHEYPDPDDIIKEIEKEISRPDDQEDEAAHASQQPEEIPKGVRPRAEKLGASSKKASKLSDGKSIHAVAISYAAATFIFVLILAILVMLKEPMVRTWPSSAAIYHLLGMSVTTPGQGIEFDRVSAILSDDGKIHIEGFLLNLKSEEQPIPIIQAEIKDNYGSPLLIWHIEPPVKMLEAEESLPISVEYPHMPEGADSLHLSFILSKAGKTMAAKKQDVAIEHDEDASHDKHDDTHGAEAEHGKHDDHGAAPHADDTHENTHAEEHTEEHAPAPTHDAHGDAHH